jgi:hypothetical protein
MIPPTAEIWTYGAVASRIMGKGSDGILLKIKQIRKMGGPESANA